MVSMFQNRSRCLTPASTISRVAACYQESAILPKKNTPTPPKKPLNFESSLAELEALIERMEKGETDLEESMQLFERGVTLTRNCQQALKTAEQKVEILLQKNATTEPFENNE